MPLECPIRTELREIWATQGRELSTLAPLRALWADRLIKIGARVIEHIDWPDSALFRVIALGLMPAGP